MPTNSDPVDQQIINNVQTTLEGIVEGATYFTTVARVYQSDVAWPSVNETPGIVIAHNGDSRDLAGEGLVGAIMIRMDLHLELVMRTVDSPRPAMLRFISDVHTALQADETRGGCARRTHVRDAQPWYAAGIDGATVFGAVDVTITFAAEESDLTTAT